MPTSTFAYNLDGAMTAAVGEPFSAIRRHNYTRLPVEIAGSGGSMALRYDSYGRRLHKIGSQVIFHRSGAQQNHALTEFANGTETLYLFTPTGQSVTRRKDGYVRVARDHLRSVRVEVSSTAQITAHYSAYGESIITGGELRRAFAGYEPDAETGLYNANRRLYAPTLRLFVSVDPQLQNASPYPYCNNEPFNNIDPTGGSLSSAIISGIVTSFVLILSVALTIATAGSAVGSTAVTPLVSEVIGAGGEAAAEGGGAVAGGEAVVEGGEAAAGGNVAGEAGSGAGAAQDGMAHSTASSLSDRIISKLPQKLGEFAKFGASLGGGTSLASESATLIAEAAHGEHITAWQAVKAMLLRPVIAVAVGAFSGLIDGVGVLAARGLAFAMGVSALGESTSAMLSSVASEAMEGRIAMRGTWGNIGIGMAVAAAEAMLITLSLAQSGVYRVEEIWRDDEDSAHINVIANMAVPALPLHRAGSSGTLTLVRRNFGFEPINLPGTSRSNPGAQLAPNRRLTLPPIPAVVVRQRVPAARMPQSARIPPVPSDGSS